MYDFAYESTVGVVKLYRQKTLELIKLTASAAYLQTLQVLRKHLVFLFIALFAVVLLAVAAVVLPVAFILISGWTTGLKAAALLILAAMYALFAAVCLHNIFSEKRWMKISGMQELLDSLDNFK